MNSTMSRRLVRLVAGPVAAAGIIGGAMGKGPSLMRAAQLSDLLESLGDG